MYAVYVADWLAVIPRDRFLFLQAEEYYRDRVPVIKKIAEFLGIGKTSIQSWPYILRKTIAIYYLDRTSSFLYLQLPSFL